MIFEYGEDIEYSIGVLEYSDKSDIQEFDCGNEIINSYIRAEIFGETELLLTDGLHFKVCISGTNKIIGFFSLASSGIVHKMDNYLHMIPAIKIDVFAIDKNYQKIHFNKESKQSINNGEHYYFSDQILMEVVRHCREIDTKFALVDYIVLYAAKNAVHFYERNFFGSLEPYMLNEQNMEINSNIPMCMAL